MDLVVTTSPIIQQDFIDKAINSISHIHFSKKFIVCDGLPQSTNALITRKYSIYKERLKREYPDFTIIESQSHRWFIGSIREILNKSESKWIFCATHTGLSLFGTFICGKPLHRRLKRWVAAAPNVGRGFRLPYILDTKPISRHSSVGRASVL